MKKNGKYRFSLQFDALTEEQVQAGEFLESLGNKKSSVLVCALSEYLAAHPELQNTGKRLQIKVTTGYNRADLERIVTEIVERRLTQQAPEPHIPSADSPSYELETDISQMLDNLSAFS